MSDVCEGSLKLFQILLLTLGSCIGISVSANNLPDQSRHPPPIVLKAGETANLSTFNYYEDPTGNLTLADIIRGELQAVVVRPSHQTLRFGYTNSHYWLEFGISNQSDKDIWYLATDHPLQQVTVYRMTDHGDQVKVPSLNERYSISPLRVAPNTEARFIMHISSRAGVSLQFSILSKSGLSQRLYQENAFLGIVTGCFLAMILYNIFLYLSLRDRDYLFYLFFIFINCHLDLLTVNFPSGILNWLGIPWWDFINLYRLLAPFTTILFARSFLQIKANHPLLDRCFFFYNLGLLLLVPAYFFVEETLLFSLIDLYLLLAIFLLFYAGFYRLKGGFKPARYYLAGLGCFLLGAFIFVTQMTGWLPAHPFTVNAMLAGQSLEMILMSLALGGKIKLIQEEKTRSDVTAQVKTHLLRIISHDIANPLTIIKIQSLRLQSEQVNNKTIDSIVRAVGIIEEIMRFIQKTESFNRGINLPLTSVSLAEVFASLLFLFEGQAREKSIRLEFNLERDDLAVRAERISLGNEVLGNLLSNAIKFSSAGSVVYLDARQGKDGYIVISVRDQGQGMSSETLSKLFDPCQNRSLKGTDGEQGNGYGMPLAKAFLDAYGARIEVESVLNSVDSNRCGTIFRIFILAA